MNTRRQLVLSAAAVAALATLAMPGLDPCPGLLKVAAIYTVPFEQQWVSRITRR